MTNRMMKIVAVVGLAAFLFAAWQLSQAKEWTIKTSDLPKGVLKRLKKDFPKATIVKAQGEDDEEYRVRVYEVKLREGNKEREVMFSADGTIVEAETVIAKDDLPKAVKKALDKVAKGAKVYKIEKTELLAVVKLVKLKTPEISY